MSYIKYILWAFIGILILSLTSCKLGKEYVKPQIDAPQHFEDKGFELGITSDIGWSKLYNDTILQNLIDQALINNKDILIATAKIKEMIANKRIKFAGLFPQVGVEAMGDKEFLNYGGHSQKYSPEVHGILTFKWELDIWGNLRWQNEAGVAAYMQSAEAQSALRLTIISQVAQMYFELKALDRELDIVKQTLISRKEGVHFAKLRFEGGLTSEIPYKQSLVELARTETLLPSLENEIKVKENDFAVLLGEFPTTIPRSARDSSSYTPLITLPVDIPSSVLKRRPDVLLAEQQLIEANANVGVALTDMLPKLNLAGKLGGESNELGNFLESPTWYIQSLITGPIFNMGKNKAKHKAAEAVFEQQLRSYEKTILNVFSEVNSAIITFEKTREVKDARSRLYESAQSYHKLARLQYINGIVNYIDVLDAQRQLFDAEIALNDAVLQESLATISLYKSLGGGLVK